MRRIRFRGLSVTSGEFIYGGYIVSSGRFGPIHQIHIASEDLEDEDMYVTVDAQTVGQLTGLTDKNGVDIYEGDILKYTSPTVYLMSGKDTGRMSITFKEVTWDNSIAGFTDGGIVKGMNERTVSTYSEVAGNIHENPELLKGE